MGGDMACEVGGVDGLGSGSSQLGLATRLFHSAWLGSVRVGSARLVLARLVLARHLRFLGSQAATPKNYLYITPPRKVPCPAM